MTVDRILEVIDAGLQTPAPDPTFGEVSPPNREGCTRCGGEVEDGDFCEPCRAFLLGDSDQDPRDGGFVRGEVIRTPCSAAIYESALREARYDPAANTGAALRYLTVADIAALARTSGHVGPWQRGPSADSVWCDEEWTWPERARDNEQARRHFLNRWTAGDAT